MSSEARYYYVDAQNQAAGPIAMAGLLALKAAGTITDATLVVAEGGAEWVAFSTLKPVAAPSAAPQPAPAPQSAPAQASSSSTTAEPLWASQLSQKVDRLVATMERLIVSLEKARPSAPAPAPATAPLHAEKVSLNVAPKPGIAAQNPANPSPAPGIVARPGPVAAPGPAASPKPAGAPAPVSRPGLAAPLTPLAVPANAQKSALPLPALGKTPGPAPAGLPKPVGPAPAAAPAKGNIFSKFLKK